MKKISLILSVFQFSFVLIFGLTNPKCPSVVNSPMARCRKPECLLDQDCKLFGENFACVNFKTLKYISMLNNLFSALWTNAQESV